MNKSFLHPGRIKSDWKGYLSIPGKKISFLFSLVYLIIILIILPLFLEYVEQRAGISFTDPLLKLFHPIDVTWLTFIIIYLSLLSAIVYYIGYPRLLHTALLTYALLVTFRIAAMYSLPLNPPADMIMLNDPFVQLFGSGDVLTKDLFFSGHTSILFMFYLISEKKTVKLIFLGSTILVAGCVILQHVHYTIDVLAAPFFTFAAYELSKKFLKKY